MADPDAAGGADRRTTPDVPEDVGTAGDVGATVVTRLHRADHVRLSMRPDSGPERVDAVTTMSERLVPGDRARLRLDPDGIAVPGAGDGG